MDKLFIVAELLKVFLPQIIDLVTKVVESSNEDLETLRKKPIGFFIPIENSGVDELAQEFEKNMPKKTS